MEKILGYFLVDNKFNNGDEIILKLCSEIKINLYEDNKVYITRGKLLHSWGIKSRKVKDINDFNNNEDSP